LKISLLYSFRIRGQAILSLAIRVKRLQQYAHVGYNLASRHSVLLTIADRLPTNLSPGLTAWVSATWRSDGIIQLHKLKGRELRCRAKIRSRPILFFSSSFSAILSTFLTITMYKYTADQVLLGVGVSWPVGSGWSWSRSWDEPDGISDIGPAIPGPRWRAVHGRPIIRLPVGSRVVIGKPARCASV
jgi:hypothetical protein